MSTFVPNPEATSEPSAIVPDELSGLIGRLFQEPYCFDFFQAVRLLQRVHPNRPKIGRSGPADEEAIRFRSHLSLSFPPSAIYDLSLPTPNRPQAALVQTFLGLTGPSGVLPRHYTELLMRLQREARGAEKSALRDWFDLFNHRFVSLFYRAWEKYRFPFAFEQGAFQAAEPDPFTRALLSYVGMGLPALRRRLHVVLPTWQSGRRATTTIASINDLAILYYGGLFAHHPRNAVSLENVIGDFFHLHCRVEQFRGQWLFLEPENRTRVGDPSLTNQVGVSAVAGDRVWDVRSKIRICLGPLSYDRFLDFLPDPDPGSARKGFYLLSHLTRLYVGPELDFEVQVILAAAEVPECQLVEEESLGFRLGWNTWLLSESLDHDASDAVFPGQELFELGAS